MNRNTLKTILHEGNYSCVIANPAIRTFSQRGVADLYDLWKQEPEFLRGAVMADKVVGKGAAALMVLGGIKALYTDLISTPALGVLRGAGVEVDFGKEVPLIRNRAQTGWCPLETLCIKEESVEQMGLLIEEFIQNMRNGKAN